jgi:hypothetical protein
MNCFATKNLTTKALRHKVILLLRKKCSHRVKKNEVFTSCLRVFVAKLNFLQITRFDNFSKITGTSNLVFL